MLPVVAAVVGLAWLTREAYRDAVDEEDEEQRGESHVDRLLERCDRNRGRTISVTSDETGTEVVCGEILRVDHFDGIVLLRTRDMNPSPQKRGRNTEAVKAWRPRSSHMLTLL